MHIQCTVQCKTLCKNFFMLRYSISLRPSSTQSLLTIIVPRTNSYFVFINGEFEIKLRRSSVRILQISMTNSFSSFYFVLGFCATSNTMKTGGGNEGPFLDHTNIFVIQWFENEQKVQKTMRVFHLFCFKQLSIKFKHRVLLKHGYFVSPFIFFIYLQKRP